MTTDDTARRFSELMNRAQLRFVFVGGYAMTRYIDRPTQDVDALVALAEIQALTARVLRDWEARGWIGGFERHGPFLSIALPPSAARRPVVDLLEAAQYAGTMTEQEFLRYVDGNWTDPGPGAWGRTARPALVWYLRLVATDRPQEYIRKIVEDVDFGAHVAWLGEAERIAEDVGRSASFRPLADEVRRQLGRRRLLS